MNIKTITCHDVYNFGASLQAYALQTFLEKNGHQVEIIDYLPKYKHFYEFFRPSELGILGKLHKKFPLLDPMWATIQHRGWYKNVTKIKRFKQFKQHYLHCTDKTYYEIDDFKSDTLVADLYIAGSDQIWNTAFLNGLDPVYYCMFEKNSNKCISYAASFGISQIPDKHIEFVKKGLSNFRAISIRESSGVSVAKSLGFKCTNVLDPVFLLSKEDWEKIQTNKHTGKYLLIYDFANNDPRIWEIATKVAKERQLKIYSFITKGKYIDKVLYSCGPIEFIEWIKGADMVISNSFHATAFSVIFQKDFYTIPLLGHENSSRMKDFLDLVGLSKRYIYNPDDTNSTEEIDYTLSTTILASKINESKDWLLNNLQQ